MTNSRRKHPFTAQARICLDGGLMAQQRDASPAAESDCGPGLGLKAGGAGVSILNTRGTPMDQLNMGGKTWCELVSGSWKLVQGAMGERGGKAK
eukprot:CAMPEP_0174341216 /NCGR_PEP_ID=MMETSP0810-20121108/25243_1 /TAXON_ID=73025 ORGANISM="Eutreptiella gymnastica-like, Strain CCMP1594" /NCGR_SAMPLE_ID=MMETSP0810 /ASSEMBLY_ACC=CAM_ASM_000659 /LENGTH=93 /DNA_ID=CAMNT_0015462737 /DNA_START=254 /DNA_END=535 /DNA_ORIENTATION=+